MRCKSCSQAVEAKRAHIAILSAAIVVDRPSSVRSLAYCVWVGAHVGALSTALQKRSRNGYIN